MIPDLDAMISHHIAAQEPTPEQLLDKARAQGLVDQRVDGFWEDDPDSAPMYVGKITPGRPGWNEQNIVVRPRASRQRRKVIETARIDGQEVGRWFWEYKDA